MSKLPYVFSLILVAAMAACGGGTGGDADATTPTVDGAATADSQPTVDGASTPDAPTPMPDAPTTPVPDASPGPDATATADAGPTPITSDAGLSDIPGVCDTICAKLFSCFMMPPDPGCQMGCEPDLADCTPSQLDQVNACSLVDCSADPNVVITCLEAISCINMGP